MSEIERIKGQPLIAMTKKTTFCVPKIPRSISEVGSDRTRSIAEFSDAELTAIGEVWIEELIAKAKEIREAPIPRAPVARQV